MARAVILATMVVLVALRVLDTHKLLSSDGTSWSW
jgi:hypothetical protein